MRIVVADQDDSFLEPFQSVLRARGHEVATVSDGLSCLNALRDFEPDVLAISSNLLWGGSEGVLSVMQEDSALRNLPVLLLQADQEGFGLRRHPMIVSAARRPYQLYDLTNQCEFLSILGMDEAEPLKGTRNQFVANAIPCTENAFWNA